MKRPISRNRTEYYFDATDQEDSSIVCLNDRKGDFYIRIRLDNDDDDFIVPKNEKLSFVGFLKQIIKEIETDAMRQI